MPATPHYLFEGFLDPVEPYLKSLPHEEVDFKPGDPLWQIGEGLGHVHLIEKGIVSVTVAHEEGRRKLLYFMGPGTLYPGLHRRSFKIEYSIEATALVETHALRYDLETIRKALDDNPDFVSETIELYAAWCNLHIFESAHQSFNSLETKLCNLLYLIVESGDSGNVVHMGRSELAGILCVSRESVSRELSKLTSRGIVETGRNTVAIVDRTGLEQLCSYEAVDDA